MVIIYEYNFWCSWRAVMKVQYRWTAVTWRHAAASFVRPSLRGRRCLDARSVDTQSPTEREISGRRWSPPARARTHTHTLSYCATPTKSWKTFTLATRKVRRRLVHPSVISCYVSHQPVDAASLSLSSRERPVDHTRSSQVPPCSGDSSAPWRRSHLISSTVQCACNFHTANNPAPIKFSHALICRLITRFRNFCSKRWRILTTGFEAYSDRSQLYRSKRL